MRSTSPDESLSLPSIQRAITPNYRRAKTYFVRQGNSDARSSSPDRGCLDRGPCESSIVGDAKVDAKESSKKVHFNDAEHSLVTDDGFKLGAVLKPPSPPEISPAWAEIKAASNPQWSASANSETATSAVPLTRPVVREAAAPQVQESEPATDDHDLTSHAASDFSEVSVDVTSASFATRYLIGKAAPIADPWAVILEVASKDDWTSSIERLFRTFDMDMSGQLDIDELGRGLEKIGIPMTLGQLNLFKDDLDTDFNGSISLREFVSAVEMRKPRKGADVEAWRKILSKIDENPSGWAESVEKQFKEIDVDGSGEIDVTELAQMNLGAAMTVSQLEAFIQEVDLDFNQRVSLTEFMAAVDKRKPRGKDGAHLSSADAAWSAILRTIDKDPKSWQRSTQRIFHTFDRDGSGSIDVCELEAGLISLGVRLSSDQVHNFISRCDQSSIVVLCSV
jgi:Ca2+-binding EF-hand superfamily protein